MPLPKAPTKRASRLEATAFETTLAVSKPNPARKAPAAAVKYPAAVVTPPHPAPVLKLAPNVQPLQTPALFTPTAKPAATVSAVPPAAPKLEKAPKARPPKKTGTGAVKLFVLDTNVLMHDPMSLFPLRGTRHLSPDDHARGAGRSQEGHDRSLAQRPPGQPRTRSPGRQPEEQQRRGNGQGPTAGSHRPPRSGRQAVLPDAARRYPRCPPACRRARRTTRSWASCRP